MADGPHLDATSVVKVSANLTGVGVLFRKAVERAMYKEQETVLTLSKERVPVDFGTLKNSGYASPPVWITASRLRGEIGYGGAAVAYALAVHEHIGSGMGINITTGEMGTSDFDPPSWKLAVARGTGVHFTTGGPKYLESVINERSADFLERIAASIHQDMGF